MPQRTYCLFGYVKLLRTWMPTELSLVYMRGIQGLILLLFNQYSSCCLAFSYALSIYFLTALLVDC